MEQYTHTLIAVDSRFVPTAVQTAHFFELLFSWLRFRLVSAGAFQPGLRLIKPTDRTRSVPNVFTGEVLSIAVFDHVRLANWDDIPEAAEGLEHYTVLASGEWDQRDSPVELLTTDGAVFDKEPYLCDFGCHVSREPVSTSSWDTDVAPNSSNVPQFGSPCGHSLRPRL